MPATDIHPPASEPLTRAALTPTEKAAFARDGYVVARGLLAAECIPALRAEVLAILAARNLPQSYLAQAREYLAGSPVDALVNSMRLKALVADLLGGASRVYLPFTAVKGPGQGPFTFHQDNNYTRLDGPACNCWFALEPMRVGNGCLRVVPGSHRAGNLTSTASEACPGHRQVAITPETWDDVVIEAGDCCVFDRLAVHGSGSNRTTSPRVAYAVQFHRDDTLALIDGQWVPLSDRPRYPTGPVERLSDQAQRGE